MTLKKKGILSMKFNLLVVINENEIKALNRLDQTSPVTPIKWNGVSGIKKEKKINLYPQHEDILFYFFVKYSSLTIYQKKHSNLLSDVVSFFLTKTFNVFFSCVSGLNACQDVWESLSCHYKMVLKCWIRNINLLDRKDALP